MKVKAQNTMEIITAVAVVAVIVVAVFMFTSGRNENLANLTKVNTNTEQTEISESNKSNRFSKSPSAVKINAETAGSMANMVKNTDATELMERVSAKTAEKITSFRSEDGKDIVDLANELIDELNLDVARIERTSEIKELSENLIYTLNEAKEKLHGAENATYNTFLSVLGNIINE